MSTKKKMKDADRIEYNNQTTTKVHTNLSRKTEGEDEQETENKNDTKPNAESCLGAN